MRIAKCGLVFLLLSGCAYFQTPSVINQLQVAGPPDAGAKVVLSDLGILRYGDAVLQTWGVRSMNSELLGTSGAISVAALSSGALVASGTGANRGLITGLIAAGNFLLQALGIIKPDQRENAFSEGGGLILDAEGEYFVALTSKKIYRVPVDHVTPQGAMLLTKINAAIKSVSMTMVGLAPRFDDMRKLQPVDPKSFPDDAGPTPKTDSPATASIP